MNTWKLATILMLALPFSACVPTPDDGDNTASEQSDDTALEDGADVEEGDDLGESQDPILSCSAVRKEWDDGAISIKIYKGNEACNSQTNSYNGIYTGHKWECVELARRYWIKRWGKSFAGVDGAKDICGVFPAERKYYHGDGTKKRKGDMMVIGAGKCGANGTYGHVGIIADKTASGKLKVWDQGDSITDDKPHYYDSDCAKCFVRAGANKNPDL